MVDGKVHVGDVAHDLGSQGSKVLVIDVAAESVAEYRELEGLDLAEYKTHPLLDVDDSDHVYECVYLPSEPTASFSKTYDFPESRLARVPVEEASDDSTHPTRTVVRTVLEELFRTASASGMASSLDEVFDVASHANIDDDIVEEAREVVAVEDHFTPETTDVEDDTDVTDASGELGDFERGGE